MGTLVAAIGTVLATAIVGVAAIWMLLNGRLVVGFPKGDRRPDWTMIRSLFRFGLPAGIQGVAMNIAGLLLLRFIGSLPESAEAQAAYAVGYTELFSMITWTSVGLMGAAAAAAGRTWGGPPRARRGSGEEGRARRVGIAAGVGNAVRPDPRQAARGLRLTDPVVTRLGSDLLGFLAFSGFFITVA